MSKTLTIASRVPMALRITEPMPNPEMPGEAPPLKSVVLNGTGNGGPTAEGITRDVDADLYNGWIKANPNHAAVSGSLLRIVKDDEDFPASEFGHEPALERLSKDKENTKRAEAGSTETGSRPLSAKAMAATSDAPNDDSPRSQTNAPAAPAGSVGAGPAAATPAPSEPASGKSGKK